jgi:hypothetical protein
MANDGRLMVSVKEIEPNMAPKVTIKDDCISVSVGEFFSVKDSIITRYKIAIWEKGRTVEGSPNKKSKDKYPRVRKVFPKPARR